MTPQQILAKARTAHKLEVVAYEALERQMRDVTIRMTVAAAKVREAQRAYDNTLPCAQRWDQSWSGRSDTHRGDVVILRKTPSGQLVVRPFGDADAPTHRYKWCPASAGYEQAEKRSDFSDRRRLREVPKEYLP